MAGDSSITCRCGKRLRLPDGATGQRMRCSGCGAVLPVMGGKAASGAGGGRRCPVCETDYAPGVLVCMDCGVNLVTGQQYAMSVEHAQRRAREWQEEDERSRPQPGRSMRTAMFVAEYFPGLFRPLVLVSAIALAVVGLGIAVFGLVMLMGFLLILEGGMAITLGSLAYGQAIALILMGEFEGLVGAMVDFDGIHWAIWFMLLMAPGAGLILIAQHFVD
jgi:hypothetical protein